MNRIIGRGNSGIGRYQGELNSSPQYSLRHDRWYQTPRLLYHSGLDELLQYPNVPTVTEGFGYDVMPRVDWAGTKTLTSNLTQQWQAVDLDTVIREVFEPEGGLSTLASFMFSIYRFWTRLPALDEYILWRPLDRTDKIYRVRIVDVRVNGEPMAPHFVGIQLPEKWLASPLEIHLKLQQTPPPSAVIFGAPA